jgi:hypothetical protein
MKDSDPTLIRYLLGELSESEAAELEDKYFADPQLFNRLLDTENRLVDDYARGRLSESLRVRFQTSYLANPERRERAQFAQALAARVDRDRGIAHSSGADSWWTKLIAGVSQPKLSWGFALVILLLAGAVGLLVIRTRRLQHELIATESERDRQQQNVHDLQEELAGQRARADQLTTDLNEARSQQTPGPGGPSQTESLFATLMLTIGNERGGEVPPAARLVIAPQTKRVRLVLHLVDNDYPHYTVVVQSAHGQQVFKQDNVQANGKRGATLVVLAPASKFSSGDYILTLRAVTVSGEVEDVGKRLFHVERK